MKIKSFQYHDRTRGWRLEKMEFGGFNLLVGASGVGKTMILMAIQRVRSVIRGKTSLNDEWEIEFETENGEQCLWKCSSITIKNREPQIEHETLIVDGSEILKRSAELGSGLAF